MSDTPKTDALDAIYKKLIDDLLAAGGPASIETVIEAARIMMSGYNQLCVQLEADLTNTRKCMFAWRKESLQLRAEFDRYIADHQDEKRDWRPPASLGIY